MGKRKSKVEQPSPKRAVPVSQEEFDAALMELVDGLSADELISIPGIYEVVSEHFNNDAIDLALKARGED